MGTWAWDGGDVGLGWWGRGLGMVGVRARDEEGDGLGGWGRGLGMKRVMARDEGSNSSRTVVLDYPGFSRN